MENYSEKSSTLQTWVKVNSHNTHMVSLLARR